MNHFRIAGVMLVAACVLYALSPGPVTKYYRSKRQRPPDAVQAFYRPLGWAFKYVPGVRSTYRLYYKMWGIPG